MTTEQLGLLLRKYLSGTASERERKMLEEWYADYENDMTVHIPADAGENEAMLYQRMRDRLQAEISVRPRRQSRVLLMKRLAVAASVLLILTSAGWLYVQSRSAGQQPPTASAVPPAADIQSGSNRAVLIKSDGTRVYLDEGNSEVISEVNGGIIEIGNGSLSYAGASSGEALYNTLQVPLKGMYSVLLADGSKVWLNSLSSLYYPTAFVGKERRVRVTGEAYFEVAKDHSRPFFVEVEGGQEIEVLGTHFNVNAYTDEPAIRTTLLEGSVKVSAHGTSAVIKPGQQSQFHPGADRFVVEGNINLEAEVAWKNGLFICDGADLKTILRQATRWYDVEVEYTGKVEPDTFVGEIPRSVNLSELLKALEITGVQFKLEGKRITVMP